MYPHCSVALQVLWPYSQGMSKSAIIKIRVTPEDKAAFDAVAKARGQKAAEQRDALSEAVRMLLEPEPDMDRVQALLMGGR